MLDSSSLVYEQVGAGGACGCCDSGCGDGGGIGRDLKIKKNTLSFYAVVNIYFLYDEWSKQWISLWLGPIMLSIGSETIGEVTNHPICHRRTRK